MLRDYLILVFVSAAMFCNAVQADDLERSDWRGHVQNCLDTLIEKGTDRYGQTVSPLFMAVLDVRTHESPEKPELYDSLVRLEERLHRRAERGSNLWYDQATLRAMRRMSVLTGRKKYTAAADAYVDYALKHCYKKSDPDARFGTGMLAWGSHVYWDCYRDAPGGDMEGTGPHEILVYLADWRGMYRVNPQAIRREVDAIWKWHIVDKETGLHNRHDDGQRGHDFAFSGSTFIHAHAFMYHATGETHYLDKARRIADWHWRHRHPQTNLVADAPATTNRYDGRHCFTTVVGPYSIALLRAYELTGDSMFREMATTYIKAYDRYGWDEEAGTYHAMLALDGTPVPERAKGEGYDAWAPTGHVNVWRTSIFSYEFTLAAAQASIDAWELSADEPADRDSQLLAIARRWADVIEQQMPAKVGRRWAKELFEAMPQARETGGAYAEDYGRAISFFVHLARATKDDRYLNLAKSLATDAVEKLYENRLFKGHPAKPYYEATNGVGLLLWSLLELDSPDEPMMGAY